LGEPRIGGPRRGEPTLLLRRLMAAKSEKDFSEAQVAAKSPCRGAARRCAAARKRASTPRMGTKTRSTASSQSHP